MAEPDSKWLSAFSDPVATLYTFTSCMALADLNADGDYKLIVADLGTGAYNMKLKVYKGTTVMSENTIIDLPTAVVTLFMDHMTPRVPAVAVASGCNIYVYKNLKPYYKFAMPNLDLNQIEADIWKHAENEKLDARSLSEALVALRQQVRNSDLSTRTLRYLMLPDSERESFIKLYKTEPLKRQSIITCMQTLKKSSQDADAVDALVIGTESCHVYVLDSEAFTILCGATVPSVPVFLYASGLFDVEYRVLVCCRNGAIYSLKRGMKAAAKATIELNSQAVGFARVGKSIVVGCMDNTLRSYTLKGKRLWTLPMTASITTVESLDYAPKNYSGILVALDNGEVHVYKDQFLIDVTKYDNVVTGVKFGNFGREEGALVLSHRNGGLSVKLLKRTAKLEERAASAGPPAAQNQRLNIPKKTKVFVDQTMRERDQAVKMHGTFQRNFFLLRLHTIKCYVNGAKQNENSIAVTGGGQSADMLKLTANVQGFGPHFLLNIFLQSTGTSVGPCTIVFHFNDKLYDVEKVYIPVPFMVTGLDYQFDTKVRCLSDKGLSDDIKVVVVSDKTDRPLVTAQITMPVSEQSLTD